MGESRSPMSAAKKPRTAPPEAFPFTKKIKYEGPGSKNRMAFKDYNADEVIMGKPMKEWCRFAVCYWHTFRGGGMDPFSYGCPSLIRPGMTAAAPSRTQSVASTWHSSSLP